MCLAVASADRPCVAVRKDKQDGAWSAASAVVIAHQRGSDLEEINLDGEHGARRVQNRTWTRNMERRISSALPVRIAPTPLNSTMAGCRSRRSTAHTDTDTLRSNEQRSGDLHRPHIVAANPCHQKWKPGLWRLHRGFCILSQGMRPDDGELITATS